MTDIEKLGEIFEHFYASEANRTCKHCGTVMARPK